MDNDDNDIKRRRSKVRMNVTYLAAGFVFLGAAAIIVYGIWTGEMDLAKETFNIVLPIGAAVISYWFAGRSAEKAVEREQTGDEKKERPSANGGDK